MPGLKCLTLWCLTNICWVHDMFLSYGQFLGDGHPLVPCYLDKRGFTVLSCSPCTLTEMPFPCLITSQSNISAAIIITIGASATKQMEDYTSRGTINICSCMWFSSLLPELGKIITLPRSPGTSTVSCIMQAVTACIKIFIVKEWQLMYQNIKPCIFFAVFGNKLPHPLLGNLYRTICGKWFGYNLICPTAYYGHGLAACP